MYHPKKTRRRGVYCAAIAALVLTVGCTLAAYIEVEGDLPLLGGSVRVKIGVDTNGNPQATVQGGEILADTCVELSFTDADGNATGSSSVMVGPTGSFTVPIPAGSTSLAGTAIDCPEEEGDGGASLLQPSSLGSLAGGLGKGGTLPQEKRLVSKLSSTASVFGLPLASGFGTGKEHLYYSFEVLADSHAEASSIIQPILDRGIGAVIPGTVTVVKFTTISVDASGGGRIVSSLPGSFISWSMDFNNGAFMADLYTRSIRYESNGWDVIETVIPSSALDSGILPGVTYVNRATEVYRAEGLPGVQRASLTVKATF